MTVTQFITPEAQARRDRIVNSPSWAAFALNFIYLAWMRAWGHAIAALAALVVGIWLAVAGGPLAPIGAVLVGGNWILVGFAGKRFAWVTRRWRDLDDFLACQRAWDRWGRIVLVLSLAPAALLAGVLLKTREPRAEAAFPLSVAMLIGFVLRWILQRLAPGAPPRTKVWRMLLIGAWVGIYLVFLAVISVALEDLGLKRWSAPGTFAVLWVAGTVVVLVRLATWWQKAKPPGAVRVDAPLWTFRGLMQLAAEALALPFRRPLILVPFLIAVAVVRMMTKAFNVDVVGPATDDPSSIDFLAYWKILGLYYVTTIPIFLLAGEITTELVAQNEQGRAMSPRAAVITAISRLPAGLLAFVLQVIGLVAGAVLLIIPGLILFVRWVFVPHAVLLARDGALRAFRTSSQITAGHRWRIGLLLLLIVLWGFGLRQALQMIPTVGSFLLSWMDFAWITIATTLLYLRMGGPIHGRLPRRVPEVISQAPAAAPPS